MTLATVTICETNTVSVTVTDPITNCYMGILDSANTALSTSYAIPAGYYSYEKWQRFHVASLGTSTAVSGLRVWCTGTLPGADTHTSNARTSAYAGAPSYSTPILTQTAAANRQTMPSSDPGAANLGIGGSLTGSLTGAGYSDYLVHQIYVDTATTSGPASALTMYFQYDEYG